MLLLVPVLLQAAAPPPAPPPERIDLLLKPPRCEQGEGEDIVVCGKRQDDRRYRLERLPERYDEPLVPKAEVNLGGVNAGAVVEGATVGNAPSNRVMIRFKIPF